MLDISLCPHCGGQLRVIADVTDPDLIRKILDHPLWQQLSPKLVDIDALRLSAQDLLPALPDEPAILLLRPDRIVLARLDVDDSDRLDRLRP